MNLELELRLLAGFAVGAGGCGVDSDGGSCCCCCCRRSSSLRKVGANRGGVKGGTFGSTRGLGVWGRGKKEKEKEKEKREQI